MTLRLLTQLKRAQHQGTGGAQAPKHTAACPALGYRLGSGILTHSSVPSSMYHQGLRPLHTNMCAHTVLMLLERLGDPSPNSRSSGYISGAQRPLHAATLLLLVH